MVGARFWGEGEFEELRQRQFSLFQLARHGGQRHLHVAHIDGASQQMVEVERWRVEAFHIDVGLERGEFFAVESPLELGFEVGI